MKNTKLLASLVCTVFMSALSAQAADRCAGKVSTSLLQAEAVANFYFDMKIHEMICTYVQSGPAMEAVEAKVLAARTKIKPTIIQSQDQFVAYVGSEGAFENHYASVGNSISYLNYQNPCERAVELASIVMPKSVNGKSKIMKVYKPHFDKMVSDYEAKVNHSQQFRRICDPVRP